MTPLDGTETKNKVPSTDFNRWMSAGICVGAEKLTYQLATSPHATRAGPSQFQWNRRLAHAGVSPSLVHWSGQQLQDMVRAYNEAKKAS